jgi:hypothetical protein
MNNEVLYMFLPGRWRRLYGGFRKGQNLFGNSLLALDALPVNISGTGDTS